MNSPASAHQGPRLPTKILIAVDPSSASQRAVAYARNVVAAGARVQLVSIAEDPRTLVPLGTLTSASLDAARDELLRDGERALAQAKDVFAGLDVQVETEEVDLAKHGGNVVHALLEAAQTSGAELIVVGARQHHGILRWIEGGISAPLARLASCPILIVPAAYDGEIDRAPERIVFAVDGSPHATQALHYGERLVTPDASVLALYVIDRAVRLSDLVPIDVLEDAFIEQGTKALSEAKSSLAKASVHTSTRLAKTAHTQDDVAQTIVREADAWDAELIVMGTHGRRGIARWLLGSVAERVARLASVPLLLVHGSDA
ncbi:MAG TPA: universal stress protein [Trinickia sp.]|uniref:universal stress protein n=1 Tax=Trinickia sp. TaxID=2571163 RepID=UPI002B5F7519|nr:universal stress protein [Trinickia sp.]HVW48887.1 universal stress protein [Trinickia sp.]